MQGTRARLALTTVPVLAYLALMLVVAIVVHPPLIGWIGFGIVTLVGVAVMVGATLLFPRMRAAAEQPAAPADGLVVLADAECPTDRLCEIVAQHVVDGAVPVHVVAPVLPDPLHYLGDDERAARETAREHLHRTLDQLRREGIAAEGSIGTDDPLQALGDLLARFPARELVVVTSEASHWLEDDLVARAQELFERVDHVVVQEQPAVA